MKTFYEWVCKVNCMLTYPIAAVLGNISQYQLPTFHSMPPPLTNIQNHTLISVTISFCMQGSTGHSLGAAGGFEAIACVKALETGTIPPTSNYETPRPGLRSRLHTQHGNSITAVLTHLLTHSLTYLLTYLLSNS